MKVIHVLALIGFFFVGMIMVKDLHLLTETHEWFDGTKLQSHPLTFLMVYIASGILLMANSTYFLLSPEHWKSIKKLNELIDAKRKAQVVYEVAKDDLAVEAFGYSQRKLALHEKLKELDKKEKEYSNKIKELQNGTIDKTD